MRIDNADYITAEEYSAIMNYDPYKERCDELSTELWLVKKNYEVLEHYYNQLLTNFKQLEILYDNK